jgi:hypothetical protein
MKNVLIYAPCRESRRSITRHFVDIGHYQLLFAESQQLVVAIALHNDIHLVVLFDPTNVRSIIDLKDFIRQKRRRMRVRILHAAGNQLAAGWEGAINDGLKPIKPRRKASRIVHPRFKWKPEY